MRAPPSTQSIQAQQEVVMTGALFIFFFLLCGPFELFCERGRIIHSFCGSAEEWLRSGLRPDQFLMFIECRALEPGAGEDD